MKLLIALIILSLSGILCLNADVTYSDSNFLEDDWELNIFLDQGGGGITGGTNISGGCDGGYRSITHTINRAASGTRSAVVGFYRKIGAEYSPSEQGAIYCIDYSECSAVFNQSSGDGMATGPALRQDGKVYVHYMITGHSSTWHTQQKNDITADQFVLVGNEADPTNIFDNTQHPDFSVNGGRVEFGFWRGNSTCIGCFGYDVQGGIDNWNLTVRNSLSLTINCVTPDCSQVEISWKGREGVMYQLQQKDAVDADEWLKIVDPVEGQSGTTRLVVDVVPEIPFRFFRIQEME